VASSSEYALDCKEIHEELHGDSDYFSELSQDSDIYLFDCIDLDAEISEPDLSDSCSNCNDGQVSENVGGKDGGNDGGSGYNDESDDNEDWALWDENNHDLCMIPFRVSSGYKPSRSRQMPVPTDEFFVLYFGASIFEEIADENSRYICKKNVQYEPAVGRTSNFVSPGVPMARDQIR
jgi:hypothetical protein